MFEGLFVNVIDPILKTCNLCYLEKTNEGYRIDYSKCKDGVPHSDIYLSPGWIDLHTHVFDGFTSLSVPPDDVGLDTGVHLVADAGSAGEATLPGFIKYIVPHYETKIRAWLNISSIGLVHLQEVSNLKLINIDRTVQAVHEYRPYICGIKVRSSGAIVGDMGTQPLKLAKLVARETGLPLMVHIGEAPPVIEDVLELLDEGDVITHCYHGKIGTPWKPNGLPVDALEKALARGVKMDIGHGAASFNFGVCRNAIEKGYSPFSISTDVHIRNIHGPVYDLATTMTKVMHCGLSLVDLIASVTLAPSEVLGIKDWCRLDGILTNATLFRISDDPVRNREIKDSNGTIIQMDSHIVPTGVITEKGFKSLEENKKYSLGFS
ncbi:amidohydrolase/deacetylase family metallohydrolase [Bacillus sp. REN16]|uniref:amidohydrolase/deacetylase family metallohydrolase n=1 Tax=Bacillus sp. REN16 TaxID=2887296 RepID=UPI001E4326A5|nr:amidohydrolase/deacetylase family metallohydrolase [Bacillus sp. REN16]MCC3356775.1 amidohydrolase/deacetylase family metallohydrolase [Bacillus sp. REN16]